MGKTLSVRVCRRVAAIVAVVVAVAVPVAGQSSPASANGVEQLDGVPHR